MSVPVHCANCGYRGIASSIFFEHAANITIGGSESCPRCGGRAEFQKGTYDFRGSVISAFRQLSRDEIEAVRDITSAVIAGNTTKEDADRQIAVFGDRVVKLWSLFNYSSSGLALILTIIGLYFQIIDHFEADDSSDKLRAALETQTQVELMILDELRKQPESVPLPDARSAPLLHPVRPAPEQMQGGVKPANRHELRKAKALGRKT